MPDDRRVLEGVERLVVDGTNVLYALRRSTSPLPAAALIGRLRSIVPTGVSVILVLDGSPEHGLVSRHVASGVEIRYAGRFTADEIIARLVEHEFAASSEGTLVVTDDIGLTNIVRRTGARTTRNGWLMDRLDRQRLSAPAAGRPSAPSAGAPPAGGTGSGGGSGGGSVGGPGSGGRGAGRSIGGRPPSSPSSSAGAGSGSGAGAAAEADAEGPRWSPGRGATRKIGNGRRRPGTGR
jgi:predicted RNA-binding protein with PIN domain